MPERCSRPAGSSSAIQGGPPPIGRVLIARDLARRWPSADSREVVAWGERGSVSGGAGYHSLAVSVSDQLGFGFKPPERRVWTVRELVAAVRTSLEREYSDTRVEGEISNFRAHESGHLYFTLKDGSAQIRGNGHVAPP